ncbi:MAG: protein kinase [Polyangiaceae bacterium]|nr:protein kinase [Polyangiaceae bacterium]
MSQLPPTVVNAAREKTAGDEPTVSLGATMTSVSPPSIALKHTDQGLPERFELRREVGQGGMGTVVEAFDHALRRRVALKRLHPELASRVDEIALFVAEAQVTGRLDHPNIVPVHDLYVDPERGAFFVMKLVEGETLASLIRATPPADPDGRTLQRLLSIIVKVCDAIDFAHSRNVLHLDLKPSNIMVGSHGQVYVMDWGIAVECKRNSSGFLTPVAARRGVRGTMAYMPPEQLSTNLAVIDERADVYAIGAMLYEILAMRPPFVPVGDHRDLDRLRNYNVPVPPPIVEGRLLPPGLLAIAMRAVSRDPDARYASVRALQDDLEEFLRGGGWFNAKAYKPGETIITEGEEGDSAYILISGQCDAFQGVGEMRALLRTMGPGEVFGETALLTEGRRTASVVARTDVHLLIVTRASLDRELSTRGWLGKLVHVLAHRFRDVDAERQALRDSSRT